MKILFTLNYRGKRFGKPDRPFLSKVVKFIKEITLNQMFKFPVRGHPKEYSVKFSEIVFNHRIFGEFLKFDPFFAGLPRMFA